MKEISKVNCFFVKFIVITLSHHTCATFITHLGIFPKFLFCGNIFAQSYNMNVKCQEYGQIRSTWIRKYDEGNLPDSLTSFLHLKKLATGFDESEVYKP